YLAEISVLRDEARRGVGRALMQRTMDHARSVGFSHMTLTTFAEIPFNAPFYEKLGFVRIDPGTDWPELAAIRREEQASGMELVPRVAMVRDLRRLLARKRMVVVD
ncbi:MAG: GNAT family N-acetyltransferase, partial [Pseudomonadota bacterium]